MKKYIIIILLAFLCTNVYAKDYAPSQGYLGVVQSAQLEDYEAKVSYMACYYSGADNCAGANSIKEARDAVIEYKRMTALGLNKAKKAEIDALANVLLLKINKEDAVEYAKYLGTLSEIDHLNEFYDGAKITVGMKIPGEDTMYNAETQNFDAEDLNEDSVEKTTETTKEDMIAQYLEDKSKADVYSFRPEYLKDVEYKKSSSEPDVSYEFFNASTVVVETVVEKQEVNALGMVIVNTYIYTLKRNPEDGYKIGIFEAKTSSVSEIHSGIYSEEERPVISPSANKSMLDNSIDQAWVNKFQKDELKSKAERKYDASYKMLEYGIERIERNLAKSKIAKSEKVKVLYIKKAEKYYEDINKYYSELSASAGDGNSAGLLARYENARALLGY